jgi:hypothetical protein
MFSNGITTSAIGSMDSIDLNFSFPEVTRVSNNKRDPLEKDPDHYRDFLVNSINLFIDFMGKYVQKNRSNPNLVPMIEAFLRRMEAQWSRYAYHIMGSSYYGFTGADSSWDYPLIEVKEKSVHDKTVKEYEDFARFSRDFYTLIMNQGKADMHDLNQLISIVLLGGYENIHYYIHTPEHTPRTADVTRDEFACRIDTRDVYQRRDHPTDFIQMGREPGETRSIENAHPFPLFVRLAGFIVKHPELSAQLTDTAVKAAVDRAVSEAMKAKVEAANAAFKASGNASQSVMGDSTFSAKGGRRTRRHKKRSGHKRSGHKRSGKRSGRKSRRR